MKIEKKFFKLNVVGVKDLLIDAENKASLLEILQNQKIEIDTSCGGSGTCGACKVEILEGHLESRNDIEEELAKDRGFKNSTRLSCQVQISSDLRIKIG